MFQVDILVQKNTCRSISGCFIYSHKGAQRMPNNQNGSNMYNITKTYDWNNLDLLVSFINACSWKRSDYKMPPSVNKSNHYRIQYLQTTTVSFSEGGMAVAIYNGIRLIWAYYTHCNLDKSALNKWRDKLEINKTNEGCDLITSLIRHFNKHLSPVSSALSASLLNAL